MYTRNRTAILVILLVVIPLIGIAYLDRSIRTKVGANAVSGDMVFQTPKDMLYCTDEDECFPMMLVGEVSGGYRFPFVMASERVHIEVFAIDATNSSTDLTWLRLSEHQSLVEGKVVEVNSTSHVNGAFGDSFTYTAGETRSEQWLVPGGVFAPLAVEVSEVYAKQGQYSHLVDLDIQFSPDGERPGSPWSVLLEFSVDNLNASLLDGHEINFMVIYTNYWTNLLFGGPQIGGEWTRDRYPDNLTLGNGDTYGQWDCGTIYLLQGDVQFQVLSLES